MGKFFSWLEYDENYQGAFCKICHKRDQHSSQKISETWIANPFKNWKKAVEKMRVHAKNDLHIKYFEAEVLTAKSDAHIRYSEAEVLSTKAGSIL